MAFRQLVRRFATQAPNISGPSATAGDHGGMKLWRNLSFLIAIPGIAVCWINAFVVNEQEEIGPEFVPYEHLRRRTSTFPWGDGNHTLFHNPHINPLPTGYEHHD
ncbi:hypothetical protein ScPMuIL_006495 [Solemya velum]